MDALFITNLVVECILAILAIVGNITVLVALRRDRRLHTVTNSLIASLAVADLLVGVGVPIYMLPLFGLPREFYSCLFINCLIVILTGTSVLNLLAVAAERFIAIKFPFWYHAHFTIKVAVALAASGWVLGILLGIVPMMGWNRGWNDQAICGFVLVIVLEQHVYVTFFGTIVLPLFLMLLIYVSIFIEVKRSSRQIAALTVNSNIGGGVDAADATAKPNVNTVSKAEVKAAKKFALVIGIFVLCWLPLEIMNCVTVWHNKTCIACVFVAVWLTHLNSAINPLLYAYGSSVLRRAMKLALLCRSHDADDGATSGAAEVTANSAA